MSDTIATHADDNLPDVRGFHAHVYFDPETRPTAERMRDELAQRLGIASGALVARPVGPHPKPMFQVKFCREQFATIVPWLMLNRGGLSVLVHPSTHDDAADHEQSALWMGEPLPLDIDFCAVTRRGSFSGPILHSRLPVAADSVPPGGTPRTFCCAFS